jgi:hypothetical protein
MEDKITEKGVTVAIDVLERDGYLTEKPTGNAFADYMALNRAIDRYIEASRDKGDARTEQDKSDAVLMFFFKVHVQEVLRSLN